MRPFVVVAVALSAVVSLGAAAASSPSPDGDAYQIRVTSADPFESRVRFRVIGVRGRMGPQELGSSLDDTVTVHVPTTLTIQRVPGRVRIEALPGEPWLRVEMLPTLHDAFGAGPFVTRELEIRNDSLWVSNRYLPGDPAPPASQVP